MTDSTDDLKGAYDNIREKAIYNSDVFFSRLGVEAYNTLTVSSAEA